MALNDDCKVTPRITVTYNTGFDFTTVQPLNTTCAFMFYQLTSPAFLFSVLKAPPLACALVRQQHETVCSDKEEG